MFIEPLKTTFILYMLEAKVRKVIYPIYPLFSSSMVAMVVAQVCIIFHQKF